VQPSAPGWSSGASGERGRLAACADGGRALRQDADLAQQKAARERFDKLKAAYEVLRNPETRRQYDQGNPVTPA